MMRIVPSFLAGLLLCIGTTAADYWSSSPSYLYEFNPEWAAGISGAIRVQYVSDDSTTAIISTALDFTDVNQSAIRAFDGNCTEDVTEFKWHIHVKWNASYPSGAFAQCSKAITGNHYDPLKACGPNSEFADTPDCAGKTASYACNPSNYTRDPLVCEKGDLSGKFGAFKINATSTTVVEEFVDEHYPAVSENTPQWNIVLHGVCGSQTPRIACALGFEEQEQYTPTPAPTTMCMPTPSPTGYTSCCHD